MPRLRSAQAISSLVSRPLAIFAAAAASWLFSSVVPAESAFDVQEIAPGVYVHHGAMAELDSAARGDSANIGFVIGTRCVAVIDSGGSVATGRALAATIVDLTDKPVCYVINTHVHFDHVLGNAAFSGPGVEFIGHAALADAMAQNRDFFADAFAAELGGSGQGARVIGPTTLVDDRLEIELGDRILELRAFAAAHSHADLTVHDVTSGTLWAGDLLFRDRMPVIDGSLRGWVAWMEAATEEPYRFVVPGHGPVDTAWPAGAMDQKRYLTRLLDETRASIRAGAFIDEAKQTVAADERERWQLTERAHGLNVSRAYRELEWE